MFLAVLTAVIAIPASLVIGSCRLAGRAVRYYDSTAAPKAEGE